MQDIETAQSQWKPGHPGRTFVFFGAALAIFSAVLAAIANNSRGFPDGHLTAFQRCMDPVVAVLPFSLALVGASLLVGAIWFRLSKAAIVVAAVSGFVYGGLILWTTTVTCSGLENGWGG